MRKRIIVASLLLSSTLLLLSGCYTMDARVASKDFSVSMSNSEGKEIVGHFAEKAYVHHFIYGLFSMGENQVQDIVDRAIASSSGASGVENLTIKHRWNFGSLVASYLTGTLYTPTRVMVEGDLVK